MLCYLEEIRWLYIETCLEGGFGSVSYYFIVFKFGYGCVLKISDMEFGSCCKI